MFRPLGVGRLLAALLLLLAIACSQEGSQQASGPARGPGQLAQKPALSAPAAPQPEAPAVDKGVWPFLSGPMQVTLADDLLARNFVLIFDGSGSMADVDCSGSLTKCEAAKNAVAAWSATVPPSANLGLVSFHAYSRGLTVEPLAAASRERFIQTVSRIAPGGKTPLTLAFRQALSMLEKQAQKQLGYGEYTIVVVTDGIANDPKALAAVVDEIIAKTPINIFTIGFCIGSQHTLNQRGRTEYRAADNPEGLRRGLQEVLAEAEEFDLTDFQR